MLKNLEIPKQFVLIPEPAQNCQTLLFLKQNYNFELLIAFKMAYFFRFTMGKM